MSSKISATLQVGASGVPDSTTPVSQITIGLLNGTDHDMARIGKATTLREVWEIRISLHIRSLSRMTAARSSSTSRTVCRHTILADAGGNRLDEAPIDIVSNPAASDPTVRNGLSCIGCHTKGMKTFEDEVRAVIEQNENPPFDKAQALRLYVENIKMEARVEEDTDRYRQALEEAGGVFGGIEPIQRFHEAFQGHRLMRRMLLPRLD